MHKTLLHLALLACLLLPSQAAAHTLWVNLYESHAHPPGHVLATIGWGHALPLDDLLGEIKLESYMLIGPDQKTTELTLPEAAQGAAHKFDSGLEVQDGDLAIKKIRLSEDCAPGTYLVTTQSSGNYYTKFLNQKGRLKWEFKPMDEVKNAKELLGGMRFKAYAKSYFKVGKWTQPSPVGFDLEVIPRTDLTDVHVGDLVEFDVLFMGKPLTTSPEESIEYITATSNTFGGPDQFSLAAIVFNGKGQFRIPTAGQWLVNVYTRREVAKDKSLKHLQDKCTAAVYASTITFNVKP